MYCTVGRRPELEKGMAGKDPLLYRRMLDEIADDYEEELDNIANQVDKVLEPVTILVLGALVGFLIYAIYSPIFSLGKVMLPGSDDKPAKPPKPPVTQKR